MDFANVKLEDLNGNHFSQNNGSYQNRNIAQYIDLSKER